MLYEAGDGRVTRTSLLATHLPGANESASGSGIPEIGADLGGADHHGLYADPAFQSVPRACCCAPGRPAREARPPVSVPA